MRKTRPPISSILQNHAFMEERQEGHDFLKEKHNNIKVHITVCHKSYKGKYILLFDLPAKHYFWQKIKSACSSGLKKTFSRQQ